MYISNVVKCKNRDREVSGLDPARCIFSAFGMFFFSFLFYGSSIKG